MSPTATCASRAASAGSSSRTTGTAPGPGTRVLAHKALGQVTHPVIKVRDDLWLPDDDALAQEEPLEIRLLWEYAGQLVRKSIAVTMRTPGDDFELAAGFLRGEGIIASRDDILDVAYCMDE